MKFDRDQCENAGIAHKSIGKLTLHLAAVLLSACPLAGAQAASSSAVAPHGHIYSHRGVGVPLFNQAPAMPPPAFNPSTPYTVPASPEVPVSPASPGSVFGNGPSRP